MAEREEWNDAQARVALRRLFDTAVAAADPRKVLAAQLPPKPTRGRCIVVGGGKSAAMMAVALEDAWPWKAPSSRATDTAYQPAGSR